MKVMTGQNKNNASYLGEDGAQALHEGRRGVRGVRELRFAKSPRPGAPGWVRSGATGQSIPEQELAPVVHPRGRHQNLVF